MTPRLVLAAVLLWAFAGCSSSTPSNGTGSGGATSGSGGANSGGTSASGGETTPGSGGAAGQAGPGAGGSAGGAGAAGQVGSSLLVPAQGLLLGAFIGEGTLDQLQTLLGRKLAINHTFVGWTDDFTTQARNDVNAGRTPLITWEAWTNAVGIPLDDIINGAHDTMINARAQAVKAIGQKIFLRWGHEMNGNWYPWDGAHNGSNAAAATKYIAAYRHIHDVFTTAGATNALWVFSPNNGNSPDEPWNQWANYYPGDAYVDWMGIDGYNWGTTQTWSSWASFTALFSAFYPGIAAKGKPVMIPETASAETGGDKAAWLTAVLPALRNTFPALKALVWFHMNKETDWRINSSTAAKDAFVQMAKDPYFNP